MLQKKWFHITILMAGIALWVIGAFVYFSFSSSPHSWGTIGMPIGAGVVWVAVLLKKKYQQPEK
jgi:hypothetical protein